ncbi:MAG: hypothetical protein EOR08_28820 [Mesorhizobium sp.]|nr:MAG: hypothetical protein EOR08_28820 [Mesorhizobium sp.]
MRLFATRVWGTSFGRIPLATFTMEGHQQRLLRLADRGDRLVFVGTQTERTDEENRGRLLGMGEIGFEPLRTLDLIDRQDLDPRDFDADDHFRFPYAVPLVKAWRFTPAPFLTDVLSKQLPMLATPGVVELDASDTDSVLALVSEEVQLPALPALAKMRRLNQFFRPTTGPRPTDAIYNVTRSAQETSWTYALRYGKRNMFKVGHTSDVQDRLASINQHIPVEIGAECWSVALQQKWETASGAYDMEQRVFVLLAAKRSGFERIQCTERELQSAWQGALMDVLNSPSPISN